MDIGSVSSSDQLQNIQTEVAQQEADQQAALIQVMQSQLQQLSSVC